MVILVCKESLAAQPHHHQQPDLQSDRRFTSTSAGEKELVHKPSIARIGLPACQTESPSESRAAAVPVSPIDASK